MRRPDDSQTYLDTRSGDVVYLTSGWSDDHGFSEEELAEGLVSGRLVPVAPLPPESEQGWKQAFAEALEDGWARDALFDVLTLPGSAEGFVAALGRFPAERQAWLACRRSRTRALVRAWLEANDIEPPSEPPR
jgi:hypothetical protein